jgi:predicted metalloprotease with PDZ domain
MRRESSEQRGSCATIRIVGRSARLRDRGSPFSSISDREALRAVVRLVWACLSLMLFVGTAACSQTWTGSVGAVLGKDNVSGRVFLRDVPPGMAAAKAGLLVGDEVVSIEGKPVGTMTPEGVHEALQGKVGTKVRITVVRAKVSLEIVVERGPLAGT